MTPTPWRWLRLAAGCGACWLSAAALQAQVDVQARPVHPTFLEGERLTVECRIANRGAEVIRLGPDEDAAFRIAVENKPGFQVAGSGRSVVREPIDIEPRARVRFEVDLSATHDVGDTGPYTLYAHLKTEEDVYVAPPAYVDVVPGLVEARLRAAAPGGGGERRILTLRTLMRDRAERLFLRIDDARSSTCFGVFDLGRVLRFFPPRIAVDVRGQVHVLHQSSPTRYTHSVYGLQGEPISAEFLNRLSTPPVLAYADDGSVTVRGALPYSDGDVSEQRPPMRTFEPVE